MPTVCTQNRGFLYRQTRDWLVQQMRTGKLHPGSKLPGERALAELLNISRRTVRTALDGLEQEGLVERIPSCGAFIKRKDELRQLKLALIFPEAEISRDYLSYTNWRSSWERQQGLQNSCAKNNTYLSLLHCNPDKCSGRDGKYYVEQFFNKLTSEFDGAFFVAQQLSELRETFLKYNFPFMNLSNTNLLPGESGITYNREEVCEQAAEYLLKKGCYKITMLISSAKNSTWKYKYETLKKILNNEDIPFSMSNVLETTDDEEKAYEIFKGIFKNSQELPDAFFCTTQIHATALLRLVGEMGWTVPDDLIIMGYGNTPEIIRNPAVRELSYIQLPYLEIGAIAANLLIKKILSGTEIPDITVVPAKLVTM